MKRYLLEFERIRKVSSRLSSLLLLFQRTPLVQMLFPEARILAGAGLGEITIWSATVVAGLGAFDTVAGATTISQISPANGSSTVPAAVGSNLPFIFQLLNYPDKPGSWSVTGLPSGLVHANVKNNTTDSVSGIPTQAGSFPVTVTAYSNSTATPTSDSYSTNFTIVVGPAIITTPPASVSINSGTTTTLTVIGSGTPLSYQWYQGNSPSTALAVGTNSPSFTTPPLAVSTNYWVKVTRSGVVANSPTATVGINQPAAISVQPAVPAPIASGATATMSVTASGTGPFTYQWYEGSSPSTTTPVGTSSSSFTTPPLATTTGYWVKVMNAANPAGAISNTATVVVNQPAAISVQPAVPAPIASGSTATMSVTASGTGPFTYQWYEGAAPSTTIPVGTNSDSFTTPALTATTSYWVKVTNAANPTGANSDTAIVTVTSLNPFAVWQSSRFSEAQLADPLVSGPTADPDGDGISNGNEYVFGSDPLLSSSGQGAVIGITGGQLSLQFTASQAIGIGYSGLVRHYALESSSSLNDIAGSWTALSGFEDLVGNGQSVSYSAAVTGAKQFYRLRVWLAP